MKFYVSLNLIYIRIILPKKSRGAPATFQTDIFRPNGEIFGVVSAVGWKDFKYISKRKNKHCYITLAIL